jgi:acyl-CoA dehydrogenase
MSETRDLLLDAADRLFREHGDKTVVVRAANGEWPARLWGALEEAGFPVALAPEEAGGSGLALAEGLALLRAAGRHCAPVPLAETMLAAWILAQAGVGIEKAAMTIAPVRTRDRLLIERQGGAWRLTGQAHRIPWSRNAQSIVALATMQGEPAVALVRSETVKHTPGHNLAGEPRDDLEFDASVADHAVVKAPLGFGLDQLHAFGAAMRAIQIAGAMEQILAMTVSYAQERVQFGRPIGKFQAVQQNLAVLAGQAAAASAAADMAAEGVANGFSLFVIGAAKARAGEAASVGAAIAHQVHGAIGFTQEHMLNHSTRRLWSWRDEFGSEAEWNYLVGANAAKIGADGLWPAITATA